MKYEDFINGMSLNQAKYIKVLRCGNPSHSWRRIAHIVSETFGVEDCIVDHGDFIDGCQYTGTEICRTAAKKLGDIDENGDLLWD